MTTIYKTKHCAYCKMVAQYLDRMNETYEFVSLDDNPELRQKLFEMTGAITVPITIKNGRFVVGYNLPKLNALIKGV